MFDFFKKKNKTEQKNLADAVSLGANAEALGRYSDAGREFVKAYSGVDGATGQELQKSLKSIGKYKLSSDPNYYESNIKQQAGFSAEVLETARRNKEAILGGDSTRYTRVDDVPGRQINETAFDITAFDSNGVELVDKAAQMKFLDFVKSENGQYTVNAKSLAEKIIGKKSVNGEFFDEKYPHGQYIVPKGSAKAIQEEIENQKLDLLKKIESAEKRGDSELLVKLNRKLEYAEKVESNLTESKVTANDAVIARLNPTKVTVGEMASLGHEVGVQYAKTSALIGGSMTFARCASKVISGEMSPEEATAEVAKETAKVASRGYLVGQANTAVASIMKNSSKEALRKLGASSAPAQIVTFTTSVFRIMNDRAEGKITDEECFHAIAKSGIGVIGTAKAGVAGAAIGKKIGGALGSAAGPVGAIVGSMVAGLVIDATYDYAVAVLKEPGIAKKERKQIELECKMLHDELEQYRTNFRNTYIAYTEQLTEVFGNSMRDMAMALDMNDADSFIASANKVTHALGGKTQFNNVDEFELFMKSDDAFEL